MSEIRRARRYYLLSRFAARERIDLALEGTWRAKQEEEPGTLLPVGFPSKADLESIGYVAVEDVDGANPDELWRNVGLNQRQAEAALKAAASILGTTPNIPTPDDQDIVLI